MLWKKINKVDRIDHSTYCIVHINEIIKWFNNSGSNAYPTSTQTFHKLNPKH